MTKSKTIAASAAGLLLASALFFAAPIIAQEFPGNPSFDNVDSTAVRHLTSLAGCWIGTNPWNMSTRVTYDLASDGTVLMEHLSQAGQTSMYSAIYIDDETPMMHHFCSYGSQILMRYVPSSEPNVVHFKLHETTNVTSLERDDYMTDVKFTFLDENRIEVEWGLFQNRKSLRERFSFKRDDESCEYPRARAAKRSLPDADERSIVADGHH